MLKMIVCQHMSAFVGYCQRNLMLEEESVHYKIDRFEDLSFDDDAISLAFEVLYLFFGLG